jgi:hypothetical protein
MHRGRREEKLPNQNAIILTITAAIRSSRIDYPDAGDGKTHDRIFQGNDDALLFAKAIVAALDKAGFEIIPKGHK